LAGKILINILHAMLQSVSLENEYLHIHHFRSEDLNRYKKLVKDIYQLLSDDDTLHFIPEKRLDSIAEADRWLKSSILNFHNSGRNYEKHLPAKSAIPEW